MNHQAICEVDLIQDSEKTFSKTLADVIIFKKDRSLYLQKRPRNPTEIGDISLFGGHVEEGETPLEAAIREIKEETGGDIESKDLLFVGAVTEEWTKYEDIVHIYVWHDKQGTITGCYEDLPLEFSNIDQALSQSELMDYARWALNKIKEMNIGF